MIFGQAYHQIIDLSVFKAVVKMNGVSPLDSGRNSLISSTMYNQIKTMLSIEKSGPMNGGTTVDTGVGARTLFGSSSSIVKIVYGLIVLSLI